MKRIVGSLFVLAFGAILLFYVGLPFILRDFLDWRIRQEGLQASLGPLELRWPLRLRLTSVSISKGNSPLFSFDLLAATFLPDSLFQKEFLIPHLSCERPQAVLSWQLLPGVVGGIVKKKGPPPLLGGRPLRILATEVQNGQVVYQRGPFPAPDFVLKEVSLHVGSFSIPSQKELVPFQANGTFGSPHYGWGSWKLEGTMDASTGDLNAHLTMQEVDLLLFQSTWTELEKGVMDVEGNLWVREGRLRGQGFLQIRGLVLKEGSAATQILGLFEISQEQLLGFLKDSEGRLVLPITLSGDLKDPQFKIGQTLTRSVSKSLALTVKSGVERMFRFGRGPQELEEVQERAKQAFKELEKTLRLDWLLQKQEK